MAFTIRRSSSCSDWKAALAAAPPSVVASEASATALSCNAAAASASRAGAMTSIVATSIVATIYRATHSEKLQHQWGQGGIAV